MMLKTIKVNFLCKSELLFGKNKSKTIFNSKGVPFGISFLKRWNIRRKLVFYL